MKKNVIISFWLFILLFMLLIANIIKFTVCDSENISSSPYNPRVNRYNEKICKGSILDRNGEQLAISTKNGDIYERHYLYPEAFAHITGYTSSGTSGIEANYNHILQTVNNELLQRIYNIANSEEPIANNIYLTIDRNIQLKAYELLKDKKGAIVISEVKTGKIIALVSNPSFNPEKVSEEWDNLISDTDSPLLNRASQGLYPPGSTFKILTALTAVQKRPDYASFSYKCTGTEKFKDKLIRCYNKNAHGNVDIKKAMKESCNTFFAELGIFLGGTALRETADNALFNSSLDFQLPCSESSFVLDGNSTESEIVETSIGQGKTLVTPLHLNMITAAIGNYGTMMKPYIAEYYKDYADKTYIIQEPQQLTQICSVEEANKIAQMLDYSVSEKTDGGYSISGKTGTAENPAGEDHSWFTAYAPSDNPQYAVTVILENNGKGSKAIPLAQKLLSLCLKEKTAVQ